MPAGPSCPIPPGLARLCDASPLQEAEPSHLLVYLAAVADPQGALGRRHPPRVPPRRPGHPGHPQAPVGVPHASTPSSRRLPEGEERFDLRTPYFALSSESSGETLVSTAVGPYSHGGSHGPPSTSRRVSCPKPSVSATATTPPPSRPLLVSRTRVRNQRRTTTAVTGFCDGSPHGSSARLCPRLHHRPAPPAPGRRPGARRLLSGVCRDR